MSGAGDRGPEAGAAQAESPGAALSVDVAGLLAQLARSFALLLPVYALGYLGLSFSWVLLALGLLVWCRRSRGLKATRLCRALALLEDEERAVRLGVRACDLPAWVSARAPPGPRGRPAVGFRRVRAGPPGWGVLTAARLPAPRTCQAPPPVSPRPPVQVSPSPARGRTGEVRGELPRGGRVAGPRPSLLEPWNVRSGRRRRGLETRRSASLLEKLALPAPGRLSFPDRL